jgi:hypothetical protein
MRKSNSPYVAGLGTTNEVKLGDDLSPTIGHELKVRVELQL